MIEVDVEEKYIYAAYMNGGSKQLLMAVGQLDCWRSSDGQTMIKARMTYRPPPLPLLSPAVAFLFDSTPQQSLGAFLIEKTA